MKGVRYEQGEALCAESDIYLTVSDILLSQSGIRLATGDIFPNGKVAVLFFYHFALCTMHY